MTYDPEVLTRAMKVKRAERGWTQADLANASRVSLDAIKRYETGSSTPNFAAMCDLADAFGCSLDDFVAPSAA